MFFRIKALRTFKICRNVNTKLTQKFNIYSLSRNKCLYTHRSLFTSDKIMFSHLCLTTRPVIRKFEEKKAFSSLFL